jgi:1-acyl-sn-glycerol-3-phosphate acyltransferase
LTEQASPADLEFDPRDAKTYCFRMTPLRAAITQFARLALPLVAHVSVEGNHHLPASGPVIMAANHMTNFDVFPIQLNLSRPIFFMAKAELFENTFSDFLYRQLGAFPVWRGEKDEWALRHARQVLERGLVLGMFPEGKRSKKSGLSPAKTGTARLALSFGCPILPAALLGTREMFRRFPRRTEIRLQFGSPIYPRPGESALGLTDRLMFYIGEMLPSEARGAYTSHPDGF